MANKIVRSLRKAHTSRSPIRIERGHLKKGTDTIRGIVSEIGPDWILLTEMWDGVHFEGWEVLRIKDITEVIRESRRFDAYFARAIASLGTGPDVPPQLSSAVQALNKDALRLVLESSSMVGLSLEEKWPDSLFIGQFEGIWRDRTVVLRQIGTAGEWDIESSMFKSKRVTRVSIGDRYINGLEKFGDSPPLPTNHQ